MKKNIIYFSFFCILLMCYSCSQKTTKHRVSSKTPSYYSRDYNSTKEIVFKSVMSVLQDVGYSIITANINTGLILAENATTSDFLSRIWFGVTEVEQTKANAFIEKIGSQIRVRLSFIEVSKSSSEGGQTNRKDKPISDKKMYDNIFDRIKNAIFIRTR